MTVKAVISGQPPNPSKRSHCFQPGRSAWARTVGGDRDGRAHRSAPRAQSARLPPAPLTPLRHGSVSAAHSCASQEPERPQTTQLSTRAFRMEVSVGPVLLVTLETNTIQQSVLLQTDVLVGWSPQGQREGQSVARRPHPSGLRSSSSDREKATVRGPLRSHR